MEKEEIAEQYGTVIFEFPVLHQGWDMDGKGWVVERDKKRFIVLTNHGSPYIANKKELEMQMKKYSDISEKTKKALEYIL